MRDKKIYLATLAEWPCPGSHYLHTKKFLTSFEAHGYKYGEISRISDVDSVFPGDIVYLSNHGFTGRELPIEFFSRLGERGANTILWFWHDQLELGENFFGKNYILTGEHFYSMPHLAEHIFRWNIQQGSPNYVPLTFSSSLRPDEIDMQVRTEKYLAHFIGNGYKSDINRRLRLRFRGIQIQNTPPFISERRRTQIFLSSKVALGWHSDDNIKNNVVVERVFEGLAFGNVVISDTPIARDITDGIVEFADSYEVARDFLIRIKKDSTFVKHKRELGMAWAKANGTYWHVAKKFIDHFEG